MKRLEIEIQDDNSAVTIEKVINFRSELSDSRKNNFYPYGFKRVEIIVADEAVANKLVSSSKASELSGYSSDHIGLLARTGKIDYEINEGKRLISLTSLLDYKSAAEARKKLNAQRLVSLHLKNEKFVEPTELVLSSAPSHIADNYQGYSNEVAHDDNVASRVYPSAVLKTVLRYALLALFVFGILNIPGIFKDRPSAIEDEVASYLNNYSSEHAKNLHNSAEAFNGNLLGFRSSLPAASSNLKDLTFGVFSYAVDGFNDDYSAYFKDEWKKLEDSVIDSSFYLNQVRNNLDFIVESGSRLGFAILTQKTDKILNSADSVIYYWASGLNASQYAMMDAGANIFGSTWVFLKDKAGDIYGKITGQSQLVEKINELENEIGRIKNEAVKDTGVKTTGIKTVVSVQPTSSGGTRIIRQNISSLPFTENEIFSLKDVVIRFNRGDFFVVPRTDGNFAGLEKLVYSLSDEIDGLVPRVNNISAPINVINGHTIITTSNPDEVLTKLLTVDNIKLNGDEISATSGDLSIKSSSGLVKIAIGGKASTSALFGAGLSDCDTAASSKLLWSDSGLFSCGSDQSGGGGGGSTLQVRELDVFSDAAVATISFDPGHFALSASNSEDVIVKLDWTNGPASRAANETITGFWELRNGASYSNDIEFYNNKGNRFVAISSSSLGRFSLGDSTPETFFEIASSSGIVASISDTFFVDATNKFVGIGSSSPAAPLTVSAAVTNNSPTAIIRSTSGFPNILRLVSLNSGSAKSNSIQFFKGTTADWTLGNDLGQSGHANFFIRRTTNGEIEFLNDISGNTGFGSISQSGGDITAANFFIDNGGAVGMGTILPTTKLEIVGTASASAGVFTNALNAGLGTVATVAYSRFGTGTTSHVGTISASSDLLVSGGFEVNGSSAFDGLALFGGNASVSGRLEVLNPTATASIELFTNSDSEKRFIIRSNATGSGTTDRLSILNNLSTELVSIASGGNVGIGTTTPAQKLEIVGGAISIDNNQSYRAKNVSGTSRIILQIDGDSNTNIGVQAAENSDTNIYAGNSTPFITVNNNGNVGIGIGSNTPTTRLEVVGTASASRGVFTNALNAGLGTVATVAYSRFGTGTTSHVGTISASSDLLVSGGFEVNGSSAFDGLALFGGNASVSGRLEVLNPTATASIELFTNSDSEKRFIIRSSNGGGWANERLVVSNNNNTDLISIASSGDIIIPGRLGIMGTTPVVDLHVFKVGETILRVESSGGSLVELLSDATQSILRTSGNFDLDIRTNNVSALTIKNGGRIGIGTTTPKSKLTLVDTLSGSAASGSFAILSSNTIGSVASISATSLTSGNVIQLTVPASISGGGAYLLVKDSSGNVYASLSSGGRFSIRRTMFSRGADTTNCTGVGTPSGGCIDLAENYPTNDPTIEAGDVVAIDPADHQNAKKAVSGDAILGVVSTNPAILIEGTNVKLGDEANNAKTPGQVALALAGRVPIKTTLENGNVEPGDMLTTSSIPGLATKATRPGRVIGMALEPLSAVVSGSYKEIMVFISPQWWGGGLDENGALDGSSEFASSSLVLLDSGAIFDINILFGSIVKQFNKLYDIVFEKGLLQIARIVTDRIETKELCVGGTCINENQLKQLIENGQINIGTPLPSSTPTLPILSPTPIPSVTPSVTPDSTPTPTPTPTPDFSEENSSGQAIPSETPQPESIPFPSETPEPTPNSN